MSPPVLPTTRPTIAQINLDHLAQNLDCVRLQVQGKKVMAIIKANAYGHGLVPVAQFLVKKGIEQFGVAFLEEGIQLRKAGITTPILVLGGILNNQVEYFLDYDLELTVSSITKLRQLEEVAASKKQKAVVHLKIDTGMERIGVHSYSCAPFLEAAVRSKFCEIKGIYSHLACADDPHSSMTRLQLERFEEALFHFEKMGIPPPLRHLANSGGILNFPETHLDMVRPGIILFGIYPSNECTVDIGVKPVFSLTSKVVYFKVVQANRSVGYGATWEPEHQTRVVTVPIGYGDGFPRALSNSGSVLIRGKRHPIVGMVCMDQFMVDIDDGTAYVEDDVVLVGQQGGHTIRVEDLAEKAGTIPYEILTQLNDRIPRVYCQS